MDFLWGAFMCFVCLVVLCALRSWAWFPQAAGTPELHTPAAHLWSSCSLNTLVISTQAARLLYSALQCDIYGWTSLSISSVFGTHLTFLSLSAFQVIAVTLWSLHSMGADTPLEHISTAFVKMWSMQVAAIFPGIINVDCCWLINLCHIL